ncbi:MAG: hypothetical protein AAGF95_31065 [Chloroflexota bacterium]
MKTYQKQLMTLLQQEGWSLETVEPVEDWWVSEHWRITSSTSPWANELWLSFLVDPMYEGAKKESAIHIIAANIDKPTSRPLTNQVELRLNKGKYQENLAVFVESLNRLRHENFS